MGAQKKIAVISEDLAEPWDEGIKKFAYSIARALGECNRILLLNVDRSSTGGKDAERIRGTRTFLSTGLYRKLRTFSPDFVIYVPSPSATLASFWRIRVLRSYLPKASVAMVAMIPRRHSHFWKPYLRLTAPDIVFVPSYASLLALSRCSLKGELIPLGVDLEVFRPPTSGERKALREKHGLSNGSFVFLHVGHLSRKRNLGKLCRLCSGKDKSEVIVVGSTSTPEDASLRGELEKAGVRVIREYVKVEEYYRLADCYVFPVVEREGSIEFPLSVLEALASGLPVLTTPFGGLRDFLPEGPDVIYWNTSSELVAAAERLKISARPATRSMDEFYWPRIAEGLLKKLDLLDENQ